MRSIAARSLRRAGDARLALRDAGVWRGALVGAIAMLTIDALAATAMLTRPVRSAMATPAGAPAAFVVGDDGRPAPLDVVSTGWGWLATHRIEHAGGVVIGRSRAGFPFETASFWMYDAESPAERATVRRSLGERVFRRAHGAVATGGSRAARWSPRTAELPGGVTLTEPSAVRAGGFAGNAAIAAAAAWALQFGACLARCGARRRRRLCPRCAYPAVGAGDAEASACPECGAGG